MLAPPHFLLLDRWFLALRIRLQPRNLASDNGGVGDVHLAGGCTANRIVMSQIIGGCLINSGGDGKHPHQVDCGVGPVTVPQAAFDDVLYQPALAFCRFTLNRPRCPRPNPPCQA